MVASFSNMAMMAPFLVLGAVISKESLGGATAWGRSSVPRAPAPSSVASRCCACA